MTKYIAMIVINLVTPEAAAKQELLLKNGLRFVEQELKLSRYLRCDLIHDKHWYDLDQTWLCCWSQTHRRQTNTLAYSAGRSVTKNRLLQYWWWRQHGKDEELLDHILFIFLPQRIPPKIKAIIGWSGSLLLKSLQSTLTHCLVIYTVSRQWNKVFCYERV